MNSLQFLRLDARVTPPTRAYMESAAYDLSAFLYSSDGRARTRTLAPRTTLAVPTGLVLKPPPGHLILVCSRSGLALKSIFVANAPGVIDPDYTGEICVLLFNGGNEPHYIKSGDRIAQALIVPFLTIPLEEVQSFPETERGDRGFGSTGI